jgi:hypothetical protein
MNTVSTAPTYTPDPRQLAQQRAALAKQQNEAAIGKVAEDFEAFFAGAYFEQMFSGIQPDSVTGGGEGGRDVPLADGPGIRQGGRQAACARHRRCREASASAVAGAAIRGSLYAKPSSRVTELLAITSRLIGCLQQEIEAIRAMRPES